LAAPSAAPIVVLDSGLGGLTVVSALRRVLPAEDIVYFGDTARMPYGSKSATTVTMFVRQILSFLIPQHPKHVVIACNTATALALPAMRAEFPELSITGVIDPGARAAVEAAGPHPNPLFGVIATEATIRSKAYEKALSKRRQHARLISQATPLLVPLIEEGRSPDDAVSQQAVTQYLRPMISQKMDVLVLGCTHYPIYRGMIERLVGDGVAVIDSADHCAEDVRRRLKSAGLERGTGALAAGQPEKTGFLRCFVTDDSSRFVSLASRFLGIRVDSAIWVHPDELLSTGRALNPEAYRRAV
jgi:glutamate racemase